MTLYTPRYAGNRSEFCGPTAIAAVTGEDFDTIRAAIRQASGKLETKDGRAHPVMGVRIEWLVAAMGFLGWRAVEHQATDNRRNRRDIFSLGDFLDAHGKDHASYIVNVTGHYYAIGNGEICDTFTKLPMDIVRFRKRRKWVHHWWRFERATAELHNCRF